MIWPFRRKPKDEPRYPSEWIGAERELRQLDAQPWAHLARAEWERQWSDVGGNDDLLARIRFMMQWQAGVESGGDRFKISLPFIACIEGRLVHYEKTFTREELTGS